MKNTRIWTIIGIVALILQLAAEALTAAILLRLNMLPGKYTVILLCVLVALALITGLLLFVKRKGKSISTARRVIAYILAALVVCGCALVSKLAADAYETMNSVTNTTPTKTDARDIYVYVRVDDPAQTLEDAAEYTFAIVENYNVAHTEKAVEILEETLDKKLSISQYARSSELADALIAEEVDALILNGASMAILIEQEGYEDFLEQVRILYTVSYAELSGKDSNQEGQTDKPATIQGDITQTPFVVYISGSDTRSTMLSVSRSDVNILMAVNPVTKQILLVNTPRDYFVPNPAGDGSYDKLTHCGIYGVECSMEALTGIYGVPIDYYGQINFTGFETLVDAVGGITVYSDYGFTAKSTYIQAGENNLNGSQALDFARERYRVTGGDNGRGKNQMKVIQAVIEKATSGTTIISNYSAILSSLEGMFTTSLTTEDISKLVKMQLNDMAKWNVMSIAVTGVGGSERTYSAPGDFAYVMYMDEDQVAYAGELMNRVLAGERLTSEDLTFPE